MVSESRGSLAARAIARNSQRPATRPGPELAPLHVGDPDFTTPAFVTEALCAAVRGGATHYAQPLGDPALRRALADTVSATAGRGYAPEQVIVTAGGSAAITSAILATVDAGDRVLVPNPTYSLYADSARLAGAVPEFLPPDPTGRIDLALLRARAPGARLLVLCQPGNPTGAVYTRDELTAISRIARDHDLLVLCDEAYDHIVYPDTTFVSALSVPELADRLVYCQTLSKTFAMTGWRVGYVAAPPAVAAAVGVVHRTVNGAVNSAVQRAATVAVTSGSSWPRQRLADYTRRRDLAVSALTGLPGVSFDPPAGAFYLFVRYPQECTSLDMVRHAASHGVGVRPGSEFGPAGEGHIRVAFCVDDDLLRGGLDALRSALGAEVVESAVTR